MADYIYKGVRKLKFDPKKLKRLLKLNLSGKETAKRMSICEATLYRYLVYLKRQELVVKDIDSTELIDLTLLGAKARKKLSEKIEDMKPIELIALVDRTFQQKRLMQGKSTANVSVLANIIAEANKNIKEKLSR